MTKKQLYGQLVGNFNKQVYSASASEALQSTVPAIFFLYVCQVHLLHCDLDSSPTNMIIPLFPKSITDVTLAKS